MNSATAPSDPYTIPIALELLTNEIANLERLVETLTDYMQPVLHESISLDAPTSPLPAVACHFALIIHALTAKLQHNTFILSQLLRNSSLES